MRYRITTPEPGAKGELGRVTFVDGAVELDGSVHTAELNYCRNAGYGIEPLDDEAEKFEENLRKVAEAEAARAKAEAEAEQAATPAKRIADLEARLEELLAAQNTTTKASRSKAAASDGGNQ